MSSVLHCSDSVQPEISLVFSLTKMVSVTLKKKKISHHLMNSQLGQLFISSSTVIKKTRLFAIPKCLSLVEWINEFYYSHIIEYSTALMKIKLMLHATIRLFLTDKMKEDQTQKVTYCEISFRQTLVTVKSIP